MRVEAASEDTEAAGPPGDPAEVARRVCLRMLDRRACTRAELLTGILRRGVPPDVADAVLDRFAELRLVDDAALADGYALAQHQHRGLSGRAVALRLRRRGVDDAVVGSAVEQIDRESEVDTARELVRRRLRSLAGLDPQVQTRRLVGLLGRKGYAPGLAYEVVRDVMRGAGADLDAEPDLDADPDLDAEPDLDVRSSE